MYLGGEYGGSYDGDVQREGRKVDTAGAEIVWIFNCCFSKISYVLESYCRLAELLTLQQYDTAVRHITILHAF